MNKENLTWYQALAMFPGCIEVHWFPLEANPDRSTYSAITSMHWFNNRLEQKDAPKGLLVEFEEMRKIALREHIRQRDYDFNYPFDTSPHFVQSSLWDFYTAIGYDIKTKKWVDRSHLGQSMTLEQVESSCSAIDPNFGAYKEYAVNFKLPTVVAEHETMYELIL